MRSTRIRLTLILCKIDSESDAWARLREREGEGRRDAERGRRVMEIESSRDREAGETDIGVRL